MNLLDTHIDQFTDRVYELYGHDFRDYNYSTIQRQVEHIMSKYQHPDFGAFLLALATPELFADLFSRLSINVTAMFRNPQVYAYLRQEIMPKLANHAHIRIWCAGVATGEEAWSLAILLHETGLLERSLIYATDFNSQALAQAEKGQIKLEHMASYTKNYIDSGGTNSFSSYYTSDNTDAHFDKNLSRTMLFAKHNLATDQAFNEFHLILCRNVLIYFNPQLTNKALRVFNNSLTSGGYLLLGDKESINNASFPNQALLCLHPLHKVYQKPPLSSDQNL